MNPSSNSKIPGAARIPLPRRDPANSRLGAVAQSPLRVRGRPDFRHRFQRSHSLSPEVATAPRGDIGRSPSGPFSFRESTLKGLELRRSRPRSESPPSRNEIADTAALRGNMWRLAGFRRSPRTGDATSWSKYWRDILTATSSARYAIKNIKEIKELSLFPGPGPSVIRSRATGTWATSSASGASTQVKNYPSAPLADVYLFQFIDLFDYSLKRPIYNPSKVYLWTRSSLAPPVSGSSRNIGPVLFENIVFLALN